MFGRILKLNISAEHVSIKKMKLQIGLLVDFYNFKH